jgi:VWFA-related protein
LLREKHEGAGNLRLSFATREDPVSSVFAPGSGLAVRNRVLYLPQQARNLLSRMLRSLRHSLLLDVQFLSYALVQEIGQATVSGQIIRISPRMDRLTLIFRSTLPVLALLAAMAGIAVRAQTATRPVDAVPTLKVNARIVVLDVTVTDKAGRLVDNLTQKDFTVLEDKVPQSIRSFEPPSAHAMPGSTPEKPVNLVHSAADLPKIGVAPVTILVLDELNTRFEDMSYGRNQLVKYLQNQGPVLAQPTALLYTSNTKFVEIRDYTQNRDLLINDVKKHMPEFPSKLENGKQGPGAVERMAQTLASLERVAQASGGTPGRKNVIWVGVGFPSSNIAGLDDKTAETIETAVRRCTNMLLAARITMYTIDPTANTTTTLAISTPDDLEAANPADLDTASTENGGQPFSGAVQFSNFAPATGGRAFLSRNDIGNEIGEGISAGATYYTLSYTPTNSSEDKAEYRNIRIVMKNPGLHATTRNGYFAAETLPTPTTGEPPKQARAQIQLDLSNAVTSVMSYNSLKLSAVKTVSNRTSDTIPDGAKSSTISGAESYVITVSGVDPSTAISWRITPDGKTEQAEATVLAAWYGAQNKLLGHIAQELTATRPSGSAEGAVFHLAVPHGAEKPERLRLLVRDAATGHMGTIDIPRP